MIDTSPSIVLVALVVVLVAVGVYLLLERSLTRVILGVITLSNGINVLFLIAGGRAGGPPLIGQTPEDQMSDPLPQAMVLTAIVITLGITAFLLAMAYRSWQINRHDEVQDDLEDRRVARRAAADEAAFTDPDVEVTTTLDEDAALVQDEMDQGGDGRPTHLHTRMDARPRATSTGRAPRTASGRDDADGRDRR